MNWIQTSFLRSFPPEARYLVGVSGGRDSVALLHSLVERGYEQLIVCHLNHQLRGRSSDADARFVKKLAAKCDVDLEMGSTNVCALAAKHKMSIEVAAREARYKFFAQVARQRRTQTIFLAHHADDLIETFLINLFKTPQTRISRRSAIGFDGELFLIWRKHWAGIFARVSGARQRSLRKKKTGLKINYPMQPMPTWRSLNCAIYRSHFSVARS
ncbi:MAG: tRNA lysidine(34) synthetase TilS [Verrucomicrobia bacterium]|nr:MAG: tRNA lysidine(34) synthetase TilS [Verrucomicrobiota bacterium]